MFTTFKSIGLGQYDEDVIAGMVRRQLHIDRMCGAFDNFSPIYEPRPSDEALIRECQAILSFVRNHIYFDGDDGSNYTDYFGEEYADFFEPEQCEKIVKTFIEKGLIRVGFDVSEIGKSLSDTTLRHAVPYIRDLKNYEKFVSEHYEDFSDKLKFNEGRFEKEIEKELPPEQYSFLQWLVYSNYRVADREKAYSSVGRIRFVRRDNPYTELEMEKTRLRDAQYMVKNLQRWVTTPSFNGVLSLTFLPK